MLEFLAAIEAAQKQLAIGGCDVAFSAQLAMSLLWTDHFTIYTDMHLPLLMKYRTDILYWVDFNETFRETCRMRNK